MTTRELIGKGAAAVAAMAGRIDPGTDLSGATPCTDFDLRTLVNHALGTVAAMERVGRKEPLDPDHPWGGEADQTGGDWRGRLADQVTATARAWSAPEAWQGSVDLGGGEQPATDIGDMAFVEIMMHGWDIARATGQQLEVPEEVGHDLLRAVSASAELGRRMHAYGDEVVVPADASDFDKALGQAGRDPQWGVAR